MFYESISEVWKKTGLSRRIIRTRCHSEETRYAAYRWAESQTRILVADVSSRTEKCVDFTIEKALSEHEILLFQGSENISI